MQLVINIDDNLYKRLFDNGVDNYEDAVDMAKAIRKGILIKADKNGIFIPENATNGDMFMAMFPNLKVEDNGGSIYVHYPDGGWITFDREWWIAPYEKEVEE